MEPMSRESNRLATFTGWPSDSPVRPNDLAEVGFFYTGVADRVRCAFCQGSLEKWSQGDIPKNEHQRYYPRCTFVRRYHAGNVEDNGRPLNSQFQGVASPQYPGYADISTRLSSFFNWPKGKAQIPVDLASAGLFFTGYGDSVTCFYCGVVLRNWEKDDDAQVEHARWSPNCHYMSSAPKSTNTRCNSTKRFSIDRPAGGVQVQCTQELVFPPYQNIDKRLESFQTMHTKVVNNKELVGAGYFYDSEALMSGCPVNYKQQAAAGYFYDSMTLAIKCFSCGMVLSPLNWTDQNLFLVHNRDSPHCKYINNLSQICQTMGLVLDRDSAMDVAPVILHQITRTVVTQKTERFQGIHPESFGGENSRLREEKICKICLDEPVNNVFLPCSHLVCCQRCSRSYSICIVCRRKIWARVTVVLL